MPLALLHTHNVRRGLYISHNSPLILTLLLSQRLQPPPCTSNLFSAPPRPPYPSLLSTANNPTSKVSPVAPPLVAMEVPMVTGGDENSDPLHLPEHDIRQDKTTHTQYMYLLTYHDEEMMECETDCLFSTLYNCPSRVGKNPNM